MMWVSGQGCGFCNRSSFYDNVQWAKPLPWAGFRIPMCAHCRAMPEEMMERLCPIPKPPPGPPKSLAAEKLRFRQGVTWEMVSEALLGRWYGGDDEISLQEEVESALIKAGVLEYQGAR